MLIKDNPYKDSCEKFDLISNGYYPMTFGYL